MKVLFFALIFLLVACQSIENKPQEQELPGKYYRVKKGDSLSTIAKKHQLDPQEIMDTNGIESPKSLRVGQALFLPDSDPIGAKIIKLARPIAPAKPETKREQTVARVQEPRAQKIMEFPVLNGKIFKEFSRNKKNPYDGLGIKASRGEKVLSALGGRVIFVGDDGTRFGLIVIIEHEVPYITVYTHLDKALVIAGQNIKQKAAIGLVGMSGGASFPQLHFQVRVKQRPENPRLYLKI